ncbi:DUF177 domain-containing protein [soil metagenome]
MKIRPFDALKLDVEAFANAAGHLEGQWPLANFDRITEEIPPEAVDAASEPVQWSLDGEKRPARGALPETWLHLTAKTSLAMECQRCLQPVAVPLDIASSFRFVHDEATAEALDADSEEDILVLERSMNARLLIEDELLLALPVVALHDECPEPLPVPEDGVPGEEDVKPNAFASLAALKRGGAN